MNNNTDKNQDEFNPDNYAPMPNNLIEQDEELDYLIDASPEEVGMVYAKEEEVVDTTTKFLNIEGAEFGEQIFNALREGHLDPIKTLLMLKKMSHIHDYFLGSTKGKFNSKAKEYIKDKVMATVGKESYQAYGATVSIQAVGGATSMDYSECGDLLLNRLIELEREIKDSISKRKEYIKTNLPAESRTLGIRTLKETYTNLPVIVNQELWEETVVNIRPPVKTSKDGIVVRFAKKRK